MRVVREKQCGRPAGWLGRRTTWSWVLSAAVTLAVLAAAVLSTGPGRACNTPVYRYAMYNWSQSPYYVFYFHEAEPSAAEQEVNQILTDLGDSFPMTINLGLESVDASDEEKLEYLPENVTEAWAARPEGVTSRYLVYSTRGVELFAGELDKETIDAMIDSPARQKLCGLLGEGNAAVLVFVPGPDEEENRRVEKVLVDVAAQVASGKLPGGFEDPAFSSVLPAESSEDEAAGDDDAGGADAGGDDATGEPSDDDGDGDPTDLLGQAAEPQEAALRLAQMKLDRSDESEQWLLRSLMAIEPDLYDFVDKPMVFAAYGRGRAMEPYIGDGITVENLIDCVMFLSGPCSCMVKDQNPGVDLLVKFDWEAAADKMAEDDWTLDPSGPLAYQEYPAEELGNPDPSPAEPAEPMEPAEPTEPVAMAEVSPETSDTSDPSTPAVASEGENTPESITPEPVETGVGDEPAVEEAPSDEAESEASGDESTEEAAAVHEEASTSFLRGRMLGFALVFGAVLAVLAVGTLLVVLRQG